MLRHLWINKYGVQVPRSQYEVIDSGVPTFDHGGKRGYWYQLSSLVQALSSLILFKCQCNNDYRLGFRCASTSWSKPHIMQAISVDSSDHIDFPHIDLSPPCDSAMLCAIFLTRHRHRIFAGQSSSGTLAASHVQNPQAYWCLLWSVLRALGV